MSYLDLLKARKAEPEAPERAKPHPLPIEITEPVASTSRPDLTARAEALITLYGPLQIESGMNGCAIGIVNPETLVRLYHAWPWGIISTHSGVALMKWDRKELLEQELS